MDMFDRLTRIVAGVGNDTEAVGQAKFDGKLCRNFKDVGYISAVCFINAENRLDMNFGDYENVNGRLGLEVINATTFSSS